MTHSNKLARSYYSTNVSHTCAQEAPQHVGSSIVSQMVVNF